LPTYYVTKKISTLSAFVAAEDHNQLGLVLVTYSPPKGQTGREAGAQSPTSH
jgi:hypothetical protein